MASTREMVDELARHLSTNSTAGGSTAFVIGTNTFANYAPASTRACLILTESPGGPPGFHFGSGDLPSWENQHVQIAGRTTAPANGATVPVPTNAKRLVRRALTQLEKVTNQNVQGSYYLRIEPIGSLALLRVEDDGRQVHGLTMSVLRQPSTSGLN